MHGWYLFTGCTSGAWFLLVEELVFYLFSINIWYIFYKIPDNYGLLLKKVKDTSRFRMTFRN